MYSLPSTSNSREPQPLAIKGGVPPTLRNARTGELTPPGISFWAWTRSASERISFMVMGRSGTCPTIASDQLVQEEVHDDFVERAIQVLEQAALETEIRLCACKQILHEGAEAGTAPNELHHPRRYRAVQESTQKHPL